MEKNKKSQSAFNFVVASVVFHMAAFIGLIAIPAAKKLKLGDSRAIMEIGITQAQAEADVADSQTEAQAPVIKEALSQAQEAEVAAEQPKALQEPRQEEAAPEPKAEAKEASVTDEKSEVVTVLPEKAPEPVEKEPEIAAEEMKAVETLEPLAPEEKVEAAEVQPVEKQEQKIEQQQVEEKKEDDTKTIVEAPTEPAQPAPVAEQKQPESEEKSQSQAAAVAEKSAPQQKGNSAVEVKGIQNAYQLRQAPGNRAPAYPTDDRLRGNQGVVKLMYRVTAQGQVENVEIVQSSGHPSLDAEAVNAVKKYKYQPGQAGLTYHPVEFKLRGPRQKLPGRLRTSS